MADTKPAEATVTIDWQVPENTPTYYATHMTVQKTAEEYIVSFFELRPPIIVGDIETKKKVLSELKFIPAICLSRIVVSRGRMPEFAEVLSRNVDAKSDADKAKE